MNPSGDGFVIDADIEVLACLTNIANQAHRAHVARAELPVWRQELGETLGRTMQQLPRRATYPNVRAMVEAQEVPHLGFVSYSARVVLGVDRFVVQGLADCLELALAEADDPEFETIIGADLSDVRGMYLTVSAALGNFADAHKRAFPS